MLGLVSAIDPVVGTLVVIHKFFADALIREIAQTVAHTEFRS